LTAVQMEEKPCLFPIDDGGEASPMVVTGTLKRIGLVASILAMSGVALFASWEISYKTHLGTWETDSHLDVVSLAANQKQLVEGWKSAISKTCNSAEGLQGDILKMKETTDLANQEISGWAQVAAKENDAEVREHVHRMAETQVNVENIQGYFKVLCRGQHILYNSAKKAEEKKNVGSELKVMKKAVDRGFEALNELMTKVSVVQTDSKVLAAEAQDMLRRVKRYKKKLAASGCKSQKDMHERADVLGDGVRRGINSMRMLKVKTML